MFRCFLFALFVAVAAAAPAEPPPRLNTKLGSLKGSIMKSQLGRTFLAFRGIPYAKPPIGDLRFKLPEPTEPWSGELDASRDGPVCIQAALILSGKTMGKEDCLILNVYIPRLPEDGVKLPVMIFVHGGGFILGSGNPLFSGPRKLLDKDIVLVTINYRLGAFGFLGTGDKASSGNWGLHDQALALQWVRQNIASFGGDPEQITIFGESAGAISVQHLMLNPKLDGMFKRVICQSGTVLQPRFLYKNPLPTAQKLAKSLKCPTSSTQEMVDCIRTKTTIEIYKAENDIRTVSHIMPFDFGPVVEAKGTDNAFLTEDPEILLKEGRFHRNVSVISGVNRDEIAIFIQDFYDELNNGVYDEHFMDNHLRQIMGYFVAVNSTKAFQRAVAEYFLGVDLKDEHQFRRTLIDVGSDGFFKAPNDLSVRYMSKYITTYMYTFEYRGTSWLGGVLGNKDNISVGHADDILYLFDGTGNLKGADLEVSKTFVNLWTSFAIYGDPTQYITPKWEPLSPDVIRYMRIADTLSMHEGYRTEQMKFWNEDMKELRD